MNDSGAIGPKMTSKEKAKIWFLELRAPFFTAAIVPVLFGAALVWWMVKTPDIGLFLLTLAAAILLHAGTNMVNDYFDYKSGGDLINKARSPFNGGSPFLIEGVLDPKKVYFASLLCFALGGLIGLYLAWSINWWILPIGVIGAFLGYSYVAPKINLAARGVGEVAVGLGFGPLMVLGTYIVLSGEVDLIAFVAGLPIGFLITLLLYINQFPDMEADASVGKNHWIVRLGRRKASAGYPAILAVTYGFVAVAIIFELLPLLTVLFFLTIPFALKASKIVVNNCENVKALLPAQAMTIQIHLIGGLLLTAGVAFSVGII